MVPIPEQKYEFSEIKILNERITDLIFFDGNISQWVTDTCYLLAVIFGESHHSIKDMYLLIQSIEYAPEELASDIYRQNEWGKVKDNILNILQMCQQELEILHAQTYRNEISDSSLLSEYVSVTRIQELCAIKSERVDLKKLIKLCEELNIAHANNLNFSVAMLVRAILDHIPPIFSKRTFKEVASEYGGKSFKDTMQHLENGARKIADSHLHIPISKKQALPTSVQVNFSQYIDVLLGEVICILQSVKQTE
ncbi:hypothetical protein Ava_0764 [Trichormus variabilis ATCC 29413]|uniref:Abortive infection protein-like C-terminal domain-containing protein n=3 Tax=Anabaena variabilis TaxID=264691 RepID=Q3MF48_TRIV2|nr:MULTISPECIES: hypothetical protein [Nostocaceae]MBC1309512.1 hypothetical protein [Trichormus variabilis PNB]ABA20388.1 hypothetical protein Ava_0764 [Trichormus variabilis ATCC 29413]MBC1212634.1 hypothetical protein [Trichormus variabilis ARAD]MBC1254401.1 hypothetical protein [Trichormus variabilis V5]MBC1265523.1 hypothetical protein [Trichormus variabilis FSR]